MCYIDGLIQERRNSIANALELRLPCTNPSIHVVAVGNASSRRCLLLYGPLARYVKLRVAHAPGMPGTFSPPPQVSDPDMHHDTCVTHVPRCMPGSLISGFLWSWWRGKHSRCMHDPQFYVSGKRPMEKGGDSPGMKKHSVIVSMTKGILEMLPSKRRLRFITETS